MNEALRTSCPACAGSGQVSFLRSGHWINIHCPGKNGPVDVDDSPTVHELDNWNASKLARIEYKNPLEKIRGGQEYHFQAFLSAINGGWSALLVLVIDEGQTDMDDEAKYKWRVSDHPMTWGEDFFRTDTVGNLGARISNWLWPGASA